MKRNLLFAFAILLVALGLFLLVKVIFSFKDIEKGGLQVTANIKSKVFLNGKAIGDTPLSKTDPNNTIPVGDYQLRIEPQDATYSSYTTRIRINGGVLTAVDRTFLPGSLASAYTLTLEKSSNPKPDIEITSIPDGALVTIDSVAVGATPYKTDTLSSSEHEIEIQKEGFAKKTIRIRAVTSHILIVSAQLGTEGAIGQTLQPTPSTTIAPSPSITQSTPSITVLATPNGFLRVRSGPGTTYSEITTIKPGETHNLLKEESGWYQIQVDNQTTGWISSLYAKKN